MTLEEFLKNLTDAHIEYKELNDKGTFTMFPRDYEFIEGRKYFVELYNNDEMVKEFITKYDIERLKLHLETEKYDIIRKYGDLSEFTVYFKKNDLNGICKYFDKMNKYHQVVTFNEHVKKYGEDHSKQYFDQTHLLNDYYESIINYDLSGFYKLFVKLDLLYITIASLENLENYEHDLKILYNL